MAKTKLYTEIAAGDRFGKWAVTALPPARNGRRYITCRCQCGAEKDLLAFTLANGSSTGCRSCREPMSDAAKRIIGAANRRHGMAKSPEYRAWHSLKGRCLNPNDPAYGDYGARGISVCDRWINSFEVFFTDMGPRPSGRHSIERVNNEKGYSPDNCEWREYEDQNRNRRNTVIVEYEGRRVPLAALAADSPIPYGEVHRRVMQLGWPVHRAITQPLRAHTRRRP